MPAKSANGFSATITTRKISVRPASRMFSAISFGVLRRSAPSTRVIIRSRNDLPGSCVISTTIRSDSTRVPPVTAERSPPDSRMTGADSPVIADSSTDAMPSITVPSPGITSPAVDDHHVALASSDAATSRPSASRAVVVVRIARSDAACARPRPSASASARLAKSTVSHSQIAIVTVNQRGSSPPPKIAAIVVITAPTSTTNMTGLRICMRGSSLCSDAARMSGELAGRLPRGGSGRGGRQRSSVQRLVQLGGVDAGFTDQPRKRPSVLRARAYAREREAAHAGDAAGLDDGVRWEMCGSTPEAEFVTASIGGSAPSFIAR